MPAMQRAFHAFLLAFALLFAQGGVFTHAISHLAPVTHAEDDDGLPHEPVCELCVGFAHLSGSAPLPESLPQPVILARHERPLHSAAPVITRNEFHSRARAPPVFS
jgi:hypothetical protein